MARTYPSPSAAEEVTLVPDRLRCEHCAAPLKARYTNHRTVIHLD